MTKDNKAFFSLRTDKASLDKLQYIAFMEDRSKTQELLHMIKARVAVFEAEEGEITPDLLRKLKD